MTSAWTDFNDAENVSFSLIPKGTLVKVRMLLKPGGFDDPAQGWTQGWATRSDTGAVYLNAEFIVLDGRYARRKLWSLIGLHSPKGADWAMMGRSFIKSALNSALGLHPEDMGATAQAGRRITGFADLDGLVFAAQVGWEKDSHGEDRAVVKMPIMPDHPQYQAVMQGDGNALPASLPAMPAAARQPPPVTARPTWA